jgi:hypothetical protein
MLISMKTISSLSLLLFITSCNFSCSNSRRHREYANDIEIARKKITKINNSNYEEYIKKEMVGIVISRCHTDLYDYGKVIYTDCINDLIGEVKDVD